MHWSLHMLPQRAHLPYLERKLQYANVRAPLNGLSAERWSHTCLCIQCTSLAEQHPLDGPLYSRRAEKEVQLFPYLGIINYAAQGKPRSTSAEHGALSHLSALFDRVFMHHGGISTLLA